ncbi:MAG: lipoprotein-releasing ABC transporter permease subunit [Hyphomonadaceae bacterium]|nr:lipoprotein-releasing ABC transporter permease subunit [Hyphomonadaceae bacterium]
MKGDQPFSRFERMLAGRYLRAKRQHGGVAMISIISFVGIMLAVAVLIITMSVMNGFRETLLSRIVGVNGHVYVETRGMTPQAIDRIAREARTIPGITHISPVIDQQALAVADGRSAGVFVRGVRRVDLQALSVVSSTIREGGSLQRFSGVEAPEIIIGDRLAANLGVAEGMAVSVLSPEGAATPFGLSPRRKAFIVGGVFSVGMAEYDSALIYMPLEQAQIMFNRGPGADRLEMRLQNPDATLPIMVELRQKLGPDITIFDWRMQNEGLVGALVVERNVMRLILMMIVAIAALNIVSGLVMLVKNKSRDIAILRTMGATRSSVLRIFLLAGASVGVLGTLAGLVLGLLFCEYIGEIQDFIQATTGFDLFPGSVYSLESLPAKVEWGEVWLVTGWALFMSFVATLPPAWRASRLDPVEALRYE